MALARLAGVNLQERLGHAPLSGHAYSAAEWCDHDGPPRVVLLDQRALPARETYVEYTEPFELPRAIRDMVVRGAPAIGVTAAYAMALGAARGVDLDALGGALVAARPTAVNLAWAVNRMQHARVRDARAEALLEEARTVHQGDVAACRAMGRIGAERIANGARILTHCNAGALATGGYGTALGVVRAAHAAGKVANVVCDETRPYLQGARLSAWELARDGVPVEIACDSMAGWLMKRGEVDVVIVGADRIAANGDVANKIGTYALSCLARAHGIPFYVVAPESTVDRACASGDEIVIEERASEEVTHIGGVQIAPDGVRARHPAFDVTPRAWITEIITEGGAFSASPH